MHHTVIDRPLQLRLAHSHQRVERLPRTRESFTDMQRQFALGEIHGP